MPRRLEDVSHVFLGEARPAVSAIPTSTHRSRDPSPLTVHFISRGDHVSSAMVVAACAGMLARGGHRVLVGQTHEQVFGLAFGLQGHRHNGQSDCIRKTELGVWVAYEPLIGNRRLGILGQPDWQRQWDFHRSHVDVVLVHVNADGDWESADGGSIPDEVVLLAGDAAFDHVTHAYRAIKGTVSCRPDVTVRAVLLTSDETEIARWRRVVQGVEVFMRKPCTMIGPIESLESVGDAFLAGRLWTSGPDLAGPLASPLVSQWLQRLAVSDVSHPVPEFSGPALGAARFRGRDIWR